MYMSVFFGCVSDSFKQIIFCDLHRRDQSLMLPVMVLSTRNSWKNPQSSRLASLPLSWTAMRPKGMEWWGGVRYVILFESVLP